MTEKQFVAITANMHAQSVYQQQLIGHLVGLVHGLAKAVSKIGKAQGLDEADVMRDFATETRAMTYTLAEIPFPDLKWNPEDPPAAPDSPSSSSPPGQP